jgi:uncharacterized protein YijF (DUF1287 family)
VSKTLDKYKNAIWASLLGLTILALVISGTRARAARIAEYEASQAPQPPASQLTPVPMNVEPTGAPAKPPLSFVSAFGNSSGPRTYLTSEEEAAIVSRARLELERVTVYDNSWMQTSSYPMGDVPQSRGACTDVVVRSLREIGVDLQELVHDDLVHDMKAYGVTFADNDIDHRRVSTMYTFFARNAMSLTTETRKKASWRPGDIVFVAWTWTKGAPPEHVGVISDKIGPRGLPLVIENGGPKPVEADSLGKGRVVGHFRALKKR